MNRFALLVSVIVFLSNTVSGVSVIGRNLLEFRVATSEESQSFFEDRLDLRISESFLLLGARFETMHPSRYSAISRPGEEYSEFTHLWAKASFDDFEVTGGTVFESFGNGMILHALERSEIQEDKHINGISIALKFPFSSVKLLGGSADWNVLDNFSIKGIDFQTSELPYLNIGAGYVVFESKMPEGSILSDLHGEIMGVSGELQLGPFSGECRYSRAWRDNVDRGNFSEGNIIFANASLFVGDFVFYSEGLVADGFPGRGNAEDSWLVSLPLIVHQPSYVLMSRHFKEIDPNNAMAFSGEISTKIKEVDVLLSSAYVGTIENDLNPYFEIYGSTSYDFNTLSVKLLSLYQDLAGDDWVINFVFEPLVYLTDQSALLVDFELQSGVEYGEDATNLYGSAEFSMSPYGSLGIECGKITGDDRVFARGYIDFSVGKQKITLGYGKRPGGWTCSGGNCRYEPEFEGFEFKLVSNF